MKIKQRFGFSLLLHDFNLAIFIGFSFVSAMQSPAQSAAQSQLTPPSLTHRVNILSLDFEKRPGFKLNPNGFINVDGLTITPRFEGNGSGPKNLTIITDPTPGVNNALHYLLTDQTDGHKARIEHYLHIAPMNQTFFSEFSLKLDANFTRVDTKRPDGGPDWCVLRQWHQSAPESPPLAVGIKKDSNNFMVWGIIYGDSKKHSKSLSFGEKALVLDHWYHFRVQWNITPPKRIAPGRTGCCIVLMSDRKLPKDLTAEDTLFRYEGPIGYSATSGHNGDNVREQQGIYQGAHPEPNSHHGFCVDNIALYKYQ